MVIELFATSSQFAAEIIKRQLTRIGTNEPKYLKSSSLRQHLESHTKIVWFGKASDIIANGKLHLQLKR